VGETDSPLFDVEDYPAISGVCSGYDQVSVVLRAPIVVDMYLNGSHSVKKMGRNVPNVL